MVFGFFKNKFRNGAAEVKKVEKRDLMQAVVGGALLVCAADGEIEPSEIAKLDELIQSNPSLGHFGQEITTTINRFKAQLEANFQVGKLAIKRELQDVRNNPQDAEEAFVNMIAIASADGEVEDAEKVVLKEIGQMFGLRPQDYGIE